MGRWLQRVVLAKPCNSLRAPYEHYVIVVAVCLDSSGHARCSSSPGGGGTLDGDDLHTGLENVVVEKDEFPWSPHGSPRDGKRRKRQAVSAP